MSHSIILNNGIITLADTDFKCPKCECVHNENDYYTKLYKSDIWFIYQNCKGCKDKLGISINIRGDVVVWIKKHEILTH